MRFNLPRQARTQRSSALSYADPAEISATYARLKPLPPPPPPSPATMGEAELRALPAKKLKEAMAALSLQFVAGMDKDECVQAILDGR